MGKNAHISYVYSLPLALCHGALLGVITVSFGVEQGHELHTRRALLPLLFLFPVLGVAYIELALHTVLRAYIELAGGQNPKGVLRGRENVLENGEL